MQRLIKTATILLALALAGGCASPRNHHRPPHPERSSREASDRSFEQIVSAAAVRSGWTPERRSGGVMRCTTAHSKRRVVVDVIRRSHGEYSVQRVHSNVSGRSYDELVNHLRHEIDRLVRSR